MKKNRIRLSVVNYPSERHRRSAGRRSSSFSLLYDLLYRSLLSLSLRTLSLRHCSSRSCCLPSLRSNSSAMSGAAVCWICLDGGADDTGKPIVRDCACRGNDAGFAHTSCIIKYAEKKCEQFSIDSQIFEFTAPWEICPNCNQSYQNDLSVHIADAFVSFAKRSYGYPGNDSLIR